MNPLRTSLILLCALMLLAPAAGSARKPGKRDRRQEDVRPAPQPTPAPVADTLPPRVEPVVEEAAPLPAPVPWAERAIVAATPAERDSLLTRWMEQTTLAQFDRFFEEYIAFDTANVAPVISDSLCKARLDALFSPVHLPYNALIRSHINRYVEKPGLMSRMLGLSQYYFPLIEQELINAGLPVELRMLPIIESALSPTARSNMGATGLWQFMYPTGRAYGLEINSFVDERCDPLRSTQAACRYLADLYKMYGDWSLVLAAYNCGPGNVNKALARAGGRSSSFWDIYDFLPRETRRYIPAFIAATYAFTYHGLHAIPVAEPPFPLATDTVLLTRPLHLEQVSSTLGIPTETLRTLNPQYRIDIVPATNKPYPLMLPASDLSHYIVREAEIIAKDSIYLKGYLSPANIDKAKAAENVAQTVVHRVRNGENLGAIARKYGVRVQQIMTWNGLKNPNKLRIGQKLTIRRRR